MALRCKKTIFPDASPLPFAGTMTVAVRTLVNSSDTLQWIVSDHLGSTSTTANADGTLNSVIQYTAFGEIRLTQGVTPTKYRYTGQLAQAELGLDYYVARWYDPVLSHFTSADTIIPEPGKASAWDRYSYVVNNPIRLFDPSGHRDAGACGPGDDCDKKSRPQSWEKYKKNRIEDNNEVKSTRGSLYLGSLRWFPIFTNGSSNRDSTCVGCSMEPEGNKNTVENSNFIQTANTADLAGNAFTTNNNLNPLYGDYVISVYANYERSPDGSKNFDSLMIYNLSGWDISVSSIQFSIYSNRSLYPGYSISQSSYALIPSPSINIPRDYSTFPPSIQTYTIRTIKIAPSGYTENINNTMLASSSVSIDVKIGSDFPSGVWPIIHKEIQ
jgi:RHS repeat-associated protein